MIRTRKPERLPVVLTREAVKTAIGQLEGDKWLMASLMYGAGLRLVECLRLRVQDIDFAMNQIIVRAHNDIKTTMIYTHVTEAGEAYAARWTRCYDGTRLMSYTETI